jgi:hypothetical protein
MTATLVKRSAENRQYTFDFSNFPEITGGETLASVTATITVAAVQPATVAANTLTQVGNATLSGSKANVRFSGGSPGATYTLICTATTNAGNVLNCVGNLYVDDT